MIYIFNARDDVRYPVIRSAFQLSDHEVYQDIAAAFSLMKNRLDQKHISYERLKGALLPNQDQDRYETCLVLDSHQIPDANYAHMIFDALLPLLDPHSVCSILCGDYIDLLHGTDTFSQARLKALLYEALVRCHPSHYAYSTQYYFIYFNRLSKMQRWKIVENFMQYPWFTGFVDVSHDSLFKSYLASILVPCFIQCEKQVILSHPADYPDEENVNLRGFPFEKHGFHLASISEDSFGPFLSYKIESMFPDQEDIGFSFNALFPKFDSPDRLKFHISDEKWRDYLTHPDERKKGKLLQSIGYGPQDKERFIQKVYQKICANYICNLRQNEYGDLLFNVLMDLPTNNKNLRKTTIALKYHPDRGEISLVTVT